MTQHFSDPQVNKESQIWKLFFIVWFFHSCLMLLINRAESKQQNASLNGLWMRARNIDQQSRVQPRQNSFHPRSLLQLVVVKRRTQSVTKKKKTMMNDEQFRAGHDNFIYFLWQNFHLTFSLWFAMNISSWVEEINSSAWNKSDKLLETYSQYINFHLSPGTFLISSRWSTRN